MDGFIAFGNEINASIGSGAYDGNGIQVDRAGRDLTVLMICMIAAELCPAGSTVYFHISCTETILIFCKGVTVAPAGIIQRRRIGAVKCAQGVIPLLMTDLNY